MKPPEKSVRAFGFADGARIKTTCEVRNCLPLTEIDPASSLIQFKSCATFEDSERSLTLKETPWGDAARCQDSRPMLAL
jgi:hypothetical protein